MAAKEFEVDVLSVAAADIRTIVRAFSVARSAGMTESKVEAYAARLAIAYSAMQYAYEGTSCIVSLARIGTNLDGLLRAMRAEPEKRLGMAATVKQRKETVLGLLDSFSRE